MYDIEYSRQVLWAGAGAITWITWDTIVHFDIEVECIWRRPQSWVRWTYVFVRYLPIFHGGAVLSLGVGWKFTTNGCRGWIYAELIFMELLTFVVEVILVIRLYILFNQNKIILWCMIMAFIAEITMMIVTLGIVLPRLTYTSDCLVASAPATFMSFWLSSLIFETFLFVLTLIKFFYDVSRLMCHQSIMLIFVRDGTWAFTMIFVAMLLNLLMYKLNTTSLVGMGYFWALAVMSFAGSHVLLNLRRLGIPGEIMTYATTLHTNHHEFYIRPPYEETTGYGTLAAIDTCYEMMTLQHTSTPQNG